MQRIAKLFLNGRSQAVRLPADFRFEGTEVFIQKDPDNGNVILSRRPHSSWQSFFKLRDQIGPPDDFMSERRDAPPQKRKLFP
jgi:antitoxin VapB